ncbi:SLATT domain-containing protein [Bisgaard Taxon 45]|uniref:SLATT domain-containing protein n=1 Tax=Bisgaard Taxon 45 TaxID=304289 RepID=A0ABT9KC91_9PAST|nr:SLATT domain-containing protein [Bisgaard Taxon 45]
MSMDIKYESSFKQLLHSAKATAHCKNNAASRLENFKNITFIITVLVSLGLIFIPLWGFIPNEITESLHSMSSQFINISQIFLAVSVLVLSVLISSASYELKIYKLRECGSDLRGFVKKLRLLEEFYKIENNSYSEFLEECKKLQVEYEEIIKYSEGHSNIDYLFYAYESKSIRDKIFELYYFKKFLSLHYMAIVLAFAIVFLELSIILNLIGVIDIYNAF